MKNNRWLRLKLSLNLVKIKQKKYIRKMWKIIADSGVLPTLPCASKVWALPSCQCHHHQNGRSAPQKVCITYIYIIIVIVFFIQICMKKTMTMMMKHCQYHQNLPHKRWRKLYYKYKYKCKNEYDVTITKMVNKRWTNWRNYKYKKNVTIKLSEIVFQI